MTARIYYRDGTERVVLGPAIISTVRTAQGTVTEYVVVLGPLEIRAPSTSVTSVESIRDDPA